MVVFAFLAYCQLDVRGWAVGVFVHPSSGERLGVCEFILAQQHAIKTNVVW